MRELADSTFDFVDVQWMSVFKGDARDAWQSLERRAMELGWTLVVTPLDDEQQPLAPAVWPREVSGRCSHTLGSGDSRTLFWNASTRDGLTTVVGGLYLREFARRGEALRDVCDRAATELFRLTATEPNLCTVIASEDDDVTLAPGIAGLYRASLWDEANPSLDPEHFLSDKRDGWVRVQPTNPSGDSVSIFSLAEGARDGALRVEHAIESALGEIRSQHS